jgi:alpha-galactosidase
MGWLSWYCSRLKMTEQFVLDNAKVIAENFSVYGVDTMQVDHGWEYRDVVGHWVTNERFPHGMKWLGEELQKLGVKLGIWMAVGCVSEYAPFYAEHPDALIHKQDGQPKTYCEKWTWPPHGKVFNLDPTHPAAQEHYCKSLKGLMDAGCRYYKVDFIGSSGATDGVFHDPKRPRGNPMIRYEMQQIREAVGPDSWLRYCSAPSNVYCGIVNIGGATADIGNAGGRWDWLQKYHQQLGSFWYKHRAFWHNEPDALIVGDRGETENEARMRCAWLIMSGGVVALGDDLTKIAPNRMSMIPKCLPPYDVAARPLDLFERVPAQLWDLHVKTAWDDYHVVAFFNFEEKEQEIAVPMERLGLTGARLIAWEFWTESLVAAQGNEMRVAVPARNCRIVAIRRAADHPQVLATDMHLTMGAVELSDVKWEGASGTLSGAAHRAPGAKGKVFIHVPEGWQAGNRVAVAEVQFTGKDAAWEMRFRQVQ